MEAPSTSVVHSELTYNEFVQHICAFLQVAFETLLCVRNVYPPEVFQRRKKYNTPVYQVRHPGLANYVGLIIKSIKVELLKATIERVVLVITDTADSTPLERFVFHLDYMIDVPPTRDRDLIIEQAPTLHMLELFLRSFMLKLMLVEASLAPLPHPENTTFAVLLEFKDGHRPRSDDKNEPEEGPWVPADHHSSSASSNPTSRKGKGRARDAESENDADEQRARPKFVPIKTLDSGIINLMLHVEDDVQAKTSLSASLPPSQTHHRSGGGDSSGEPTSPRLGMGGEEDEDGSLAGGYGMMGDDRDDDEGDWR
ncbi:hypothetical protein V8E36_004900 [Tilletia maclaganii]